jgi:DNA repair exonuclease SbcCD ATPase subunit
MADTILKSVAIRNWTTVKEAVIEFPERGLVLVRGINLAARGKMASIGSGKTALGEAISRTLFGVKGRYTQLGHYSSQGKGNSYVVVNCEHKGQPLEVELGFKCPELSITGEGLKYSYAGQKVYRDRIENTRDDLTKIVTVPTDLAGWTVHLDGDMLDFSELSESKSVELLMAALCQPRWNSFQRSTSDKANDLKKQLNSDRLAVDQAKEAVGEAEVELQTAQANYAEAKNVYDAEVKQAKAHLKQLTENITALTKASVVRQNRMEEIKKEIDRRVALTAEKEKNLEIVVNEKQEALDALREELTDLRVEEGRLKRDVDHAAHHLDTAKRTPANCPTCDKPWDRGAKAIEEHTKTHQKALAAYNKAVQASQAKSQQFTKAQEAVNAAIVKLNKAQAEFPIDKLSEEYEELEGAQGVDQDALNEAQQNKIRVEHGPDKTEITRYETQIKEREKAIKKAQQAVDKAAAKVVEGEELLRVVEYWQEAFGPTGIPNLILGDALGPLNATSRRISALLSGGTLDVSYSTSRQLAKGGDKAELTINVRNELGSHRADGSSKGEGGLNNLIIAETLAEVGGVAHRIGYRWYDEVGANQDEVVRRSIYAYLAEVAQRYGILVFLVSHAPEAANYVDYTLIAEKTNQGTTYRWD